MAKKRPEKAKADKAPATASYPMPMRERETVSVRKIDNGYVITHCAYGKEGGYKETERFSPRKPNLKVSKLVSK